MSVLLSNLICIIDPDKAKKTITLKFGLFHIHESKHKFNHLNETVLLSTLKIYALVEK